MGSEDGGWWSQPNGGLCSGAVAGGLVLRVGKEVFARKKRASFRISDSQKMVI